MVTPAVFGILWVICLLLFVLVLNGITLLHVFQYLRLLLFSKLVRITMITSWVVLLTSLLHCLDHLVFILINLRIHCLNLIYFS